MSLNSRKRDECEGRSGQEVNVIVIAGVFLYSFTHVIVDQLDKNQ